MSGVGYFYCFYHKLSPTHYNIYIWNKNNFSIDNGDDETNLERQECHNMLESSSNILRFKFSLAVFFNIQFSACSGTMTQVDTSDLKFHLQEEHTMKIGVWYALYVLKKARL